MFGKLGFFKSFSVGLFSLFLYWTHPSFLDDIDLIAQDSVQFDRKAPDPDSRVAVISIDEKSINALGRWPWSRDIQTKLIKAIKKANPKTMGFDIVYSSPQSKEIDTLLSDALKADGTAIIGGYFFRGENAILAEPQALDILYDNKIKIIFDKRQSGTQTKAQEKLYIETNISLIQKSFTRLGFFNYIPDPDGILRRIPLVWKYQNDMYPGLVLQALSHFSGKPIVLNLDESGNIDRLRLGGKDIIVDRNGKMVLNFYQKISSIPLYSASDVIAGKHDEDLKDKLVFLGVTEVGIADVRPTPLEDSFPGLMAHAVGSSNILQGHFSSKNSTTILFDVLVMLLLPTFLVFLLSFTKHIIGSLVVFASVVFVFSIGYYYLIAYYGWIVSLIYPLISLIVTFIAYQVWFNLFAQKEAKFLKSAFSSYVAPALVDDIIDNQSGLTLGGDLKNITLLFSDIRSFTTISEKTEPVELVSLINIYMDKMTNIVMDNQGTLDKYIGDAMMVLYNAPTNIENHSAKAALSAILMMEALPEVNQEIKEIVDIELKIGIGIHTGEAVVGNMGSKVRFDYTAIGDSVNLAARLEGATKMYGVDILISSDTYDEIHNEFYCMEIDRLRVKGKLKAVTIYQLMAIKNAKNSQYQQKIELYEACLADYYSQSFDACKVKLEKFLSLHSNHKYAKNLMKHCNNYLQDPPPKDWDGVYVAKSK